MVDRYRIKRVYDPPAPEDGLRILVDRLWPRGVSRQAAAIDLWAKDIGPSAELRRWFGHDPALWDPFRERYLAELEARPDVLRELIASCGDGPVTLLFSAKDSEKNQAVILRDVLERAGRRPARGTR